MGAWRYVVSVDRHDESGELPWEIRELYPTEGGRFGYTAEAVKPFGNSYEELVRDIEHMRQDSNLEVLDLRGDEPELVVLEQVPAELSPEAGRISLATEWDMPEGLCEPAGDRPRVVCLCGSTRFSDEMADANRRLTLAGAVVLAPAVFQHRGDVVTEDQKRGLGALHLKKIDLADAVLVVDPGGYVGESTSREIDYARSAGKPVFKLSAL
ncbi:MAG TPA: hypothetical protein PKE40_16615, partial [Arachnia sp.]|nr:hypothetical protein [Arachnia sp.]